MAARQSLARKAFFNRYLQQQLDFCGNKYKQYKLQKLLDAKRKLPRVPTYGDPDEYSEVPEYPPIQDFWLTAEELETREWHQKIFDKKTVEQKLMHLNMPKYYGWHCINLYGSYFNYNTLPFVQFATRTHIVPERNLPSWYFTPELDEKVRHWTNVLKDEVVDCLEHQLGHVCHTFIKSTNEELDINKQELYNTKRRSEAVSQELNRIILTGLAREVPYLAEAQVDLKPRTEAFWFLGSMQPDLMRKRWSKQRKLDEDAPFDRPVQYLGKAHLQVRCNDPLQQFITRDHVLSTQSHVPEHTMDPRCSGIKYRMRHGTVSPGFWPGDTCEFGLISYHSSYGIEERVKSYGGRENVDIDDFLLSEGVLNSYGWLHAQASYQGFSTFHDVTYPLTSQTVVTDGQNMSLFAYQLNTMVLHDKHSLENPLRNVCWATDSKPLYKAVEGGKIIGFNEEVFANLLRFYLNEPCCRPGVEMKPYLDKKSSIHQYYQDKEHDEHRETIHDMFRYMYSNRPRTWYPEIHQWEYIYKIQHKTRPQDALRRFFERGTNPYRRRYDDIPPELLRRHERNHPKEKFNYRKRKALE